MIIPVLIRSVGAFVGIGTTTTIAAEATNSPPDHTIAAALISLVGAVIVAAFTLGGIIYKNKRETTQQSGVVIDPKEFQRNVHDLEMYAWLLRDHPELREKYGRGIPDDNGGVL